MRTGQTEAAREGGRRVQVSIYVHAQRGRGREGEGEEVIGSVRASHVWLNFNQNTD